jgi:hypothetical protein
MSQLADQPAAVVSGGPALWLSNVRRSPRVVGAVAAAVSRPPRWLHPADLTTAITAVHRAARFFLATPTAPDSACNVTAGCHRW